MEFLLNKGDKEEIWENHSETIDFSSGSIDEWDRKVIMDQAEFEAACDDIATEAVSNVFKALDGLKSAYGTGWVCRYSNHGRGIRLHQTSRNGAWPTPYEAVVSFLKLRELEQEIRGGSDDTEN